MDNFLTSLGGAFVAVWLICGLIAYGAFPLDQMTSEQKKDAFGVSILAGPIAVGSHLQPEE